MPISAWPTRYIRSRGEYTDISKKMQELFYETETTFWRDVPPRSIVSRETGTFKNFANTFSTASFAFPSVGAAVTRTTSWPLRSTTSFAFARGITLIFIVCDTLIDR